MSFIQIVSLIVFVLAGALFGYKTWKQGEPFPIPPVETAPDGDVEPSFASPPVVFEGPMGTTPALPLPDAGNDPAPGVIPPVQPKD